MLCSCIRSLPSSACLCWPSVLQTTFVCARARARVCACVLCAMHTIPPPTPPPPPPHTHTHTLSLSLSGARARSLSLARALSLSLSLSLSPSDGRACLCVHVCVQVYERVCHAGEPVGGTTQDEHPLQLVPPPLSPSVVHIAAQWCTCWKWMHDADAYLHHLPYRRMQQSPAFKACLPVRGMQQCLLVVQ